MTRPIHPDARAILEAEAKRRRRQQRPQGSGMLAANPAYAPPFGFSEAPRLTEEKARELAAEGLRLERQILERVARMREPQE